jgi:hypothetical protein
MGPLDIFDSCIQHSAHVLGPCFQVIASLGGSGWLARDYLNDERRIAIQSPHDFSFSGTSGPFDSESMALVRFNGLSKKSLVPRGSI